MFPVSEAFEWVGVFTASFAIGALIVYILLRKSMRWAIGLTVLVTAGVMALTLMEGDIFRDISQKHFNTIVLTAMLPVLALVWSFVVTRITPRLIVGIALVLLPSAVIAGYAFERQIVPQAACSESHITVSLGQVDYKLPIAFHPDVTPTANGGAALSYGEGWRTKEDLHALCGLTGKGIKTLTVDAVEVTPSLDERYMFQACNGDTPPAFCARYDTWQISLTRSIKLTSLATFSAQDVMTVSDENGEVEILSGGDAQTGFACKVIPGTESAGFCRKWQPLGDDVMVIMNTKDSRGTSPYTEVLTRLDATLDFYLSGMTP